MRAWRRTRYGGPEVLELVEVADPVPGPGEVAVRVVAASVNRADLDYLTGTPLLTRMGTGMRTPRHAGLGLDAAGLVVAVGAGVTSFAPGDRVFANLTLFGYGAFAEIACAPERAWRRVPDDVPLDVAAALPESGCLALQSLRGGERIRPGSRVLVNGAAGNVGPYVIQLAKAMGADVTGTARTSRLQFVLDLGADRAIDYTREDWTRLPDRWDWVVDTWATHSILAMRSRLRPGGRYVMVGGPTARILEGVTVGSVASLAGSRTAGLLLWWKPFAADDVAVLLDHVRAGTLRPAIGGRYPLEGVPDALRAMLDRSVAGKLLIEVGTE